MALIIALNSIMLHVSGVSIKTNSSRLTKTSFYQISPWACTVKLIQAVIVPIVLKANVFIITSTERPES
jgi:hypothetical protein